MYRSLLTATSPWPRSFKATVTGDSQLNNAAKHGFTALGGTGSLHPLPTDPDQPPPDFTVELLEREAVLGADGVNVAYLEREGARKSGFTWYHKTQWLIPEKFAYLAQLVIIQESLTVISTVTVIAAPLTPHRSRVPQTAGAAEDRTSRRFPPGGTRLTVWTDAGAGGPGARPEEFS